ncbi:hypothetical protein MHT86_08145 [Corynebacterium mastitidis]|uniref:Uncharacterized protein n=1 Tax=Corynebacterium mastitidis TaxID=161890 RepID=A0A2N0X8V6_9CORY|nr:hypothetical protein [Corynebacterium mastitidis]MCH6197464.1 hypothetical protein [Corynebacterium mastitidis]PKF69135.1 hypothetical protein CXB45_03035 [Corynebacterium mastitidis]
MIDTYRAYATRTDGITQEVYHGDSRWAAERVAEAKRKHGWTAWVVRIPAGTDTEQKVTKP